MPFDAAVAVRCRGLIHVYSAAGLRPGGRRALALLAAPTTDARTAVRVLDAIERAHAAAAGDLIAAPLARGRHDGREFLSLAADAVCDGERLLQTLDDGGQRVPYAAAIGALLRVADTLARVHSLPVPGGPLAIGALLPCQFLYDADGHATVLGLGDNVFARAAPAGALVAPEVQLGQAPDARSDGFALAALMRSMVPHTALPPAIERALRGVERATERGIGRYVREFQTRMWSAAPKRRPDAARLASAVRMFARVLGAEPDVPGFERFVSAVISSQDVPGSAATARVLRVAEDVAWFEIDGAARCRLASRASLRRLLAALVDEHRLHPGAVLESVVLLDVGWPGERVLPESGVHRVHVALSELRKMGLRGALERFDAGYRLDPALTVRRIGI